MKQATKVSGVYTFLCASNIRGNKEIFAVDMLREFHVHKVIGINYGSIVQYSIFMTRIEFEGTLC